MTTPPIGPSAVRDRASGAARERILHVTLDIIGRDGIAAVSNRRVAKESGVSLGTLSYHFPQQSALLRECLLGYVGAEVDRIDAIADRVRARQPHPTPSEISAEVQRAIAEGLERTEPLAEMELHLQAARDPELREASRGCFVAYQQLAAASLEALGVPDPSRHAPAIVAVMYGMGLQQLGTARPEAGAMMAALVTIVRGAFAQREPDPSPSSAEPDRPDRTKGEVPE